VRREDVRIEDRGWRMESGRVDGWKAEDGKWRIEDGRWRTRNSDSIPGSEMLNPES
jgi:hypothetical protein